jgi:hypothetical protein
LKDELNAHVIYYENGTNEGKSAGADEGYARKDGPHKEKITGKMDANVENTEVKMDTNQEKMDVWLEKKTNTWLKETTAYGEAMEAV